MTLLKHVNCSDVAFLPSTWIEREGGFEVTGLWVNVVQKPFLLVEDTIFITTAQSKNWKPVKY